MYLFISANDERTYFKLCMFYRVKNYLVLCQMKWNYYLVEQIINSLYFETGPWTFVGIVAKTRSLALLLGFTTPGAARRFARRPAIKNGAADRPAIDLPSSGHLHVTAVRTSGHTRRKAVPVGILAWTLCQCHRKTGGSLAGLSRFAGRCAR